MAKIFLRFAVWNIEGLSCKLNDIDFISKLENFDLISLVETWLPYGQNNINIDGFFSFSKNRKDISQNSRRSSGGITILVKSSLKCYCSEFFDPHFFSLIKSAFLPDLFTTNRIEIGQFKPIL
jgi:hypothetical protein